MTMPIKYAIKLSISGLSGTHGAQLGQSLTLFLEGPGKYLLYFLLTNNILTCPLCITVD